MFEPLFSPRALSSLAAVAPLKLASGLMSLLQSAEIFSGLEVAMRGGKKKKQQSHKKKEVHFIEIGHKAWAAALFFCAFGSYLSEFSLKRHSVLCLVAALRTAAFNNRLGFKNMT